MPYLGPGIDNGYRSRFIYTATAGQTSFSGGDDNGITLTYTDSEYLDVYQNGVLLVPGDDYAATTGTTVVLVQGASLNDKVEMIQYQAFGVADTVSRADGGAFGGNISTSGTLTVTDDLIVDTTSLIVDASSNKIGMGVDPSTMPSFATHSIKTANGGGVSITSPSSGDNRYIFFGNGTSSSDIQLAAIKNTSSDLSFLGASGQVQMVIDSTGAVTKPLQPAFQVQPASNQLNVAENETIVFGTERFDQNGDFASNTFTAPVTGKYQFNVVMRVDNIDRDANWVRVELQTSNFDYLSSIFDPGVLSSDPVYWSISFSILVDMDANDTANLVWGQGGGSNTADIDTQCQFSGYLVA